MPAEEAFSIGNNTFSRGTQNLVSLPVTVGMSGAPIELTVHVTVGLEPGPVLTIMNTIHGGEWYAIEPLRRLARTIADSPMRGTVIILPVVNPGAFAYGTRNVPDQVDSPDMNRIFPGPLTSTGDQIIAIISNQILPLSTYLIDFHMGPLGSAFTDTLVGSDFASDVSQRSLEVALAFGSPIIRYAPMLGGFPGPRSSKGYAGGTMGLPGFGGEIGGAGFGSRLDKVWHSRTHDGLLGVMGALEMIDDAPKTRPPRQLVYKNAHRVNPRAGGILRSRFGGDQLGIEVAEDTLLGEVVSPYTGAVLEELRAPVDGLVYYVSRDYPIYPGGWAFGMADFDPSSSHWVDNE